MISYTFQGGEPTLRGIEFFPKGRSLPEAIQQKCSNGG